MVDSCLLTTGLDRFLDNNDLTELPAGIFNSFAALELLCVKMTYFSQHTADHSNFRKVAFTEK